MGMYTEFHYNVELIQQTPPSILEVLQYMVGDREELPPALPNHELFLCSRWEYMLRCGSYYFAAQTHSRLTWVEESQEPHLIYA